MPLGSAIPVLRYESVEAATAWLIAAFGFELRWRAGAHRAQLDVGHGGGMVVAEADARSGTGEVMIRVSDVDEHHRRAVAAAVPILAPPQDQPYGERQYVARDCGGHRWVFTQSIADVDPASWGARSGADLSR